MMKIAAGIKIETGVLTKLAFRPIIIGPFQIMSTVPFTEHTQ